MITARIVAGGSRVALRSARPFSSSTPQPPSRTQTDVGGGIKQEETSSDIEGHKPLYATKATYQKKIVEDRFKSADIESGYRPTAWQKRFLVITKLYKSQSEIPEIVANGTMNRMHDRMRVVFIVTACFGFFTIFYICEKINANRIARDREAGVVVTKM